MSVSFAMILFGAILIYGGWTNRSVSALARGDDSKPKPTLASGASGQIRTATSG